MKLDRIRKSFVHVFGGSVLTEGVFVRNLRFIITLLVHHVYLHQLSLFCFEKNG